MELLIRLPNGSVLPYSGALAGSAADEARRMGLTVGRGTSASDEQQRMLMERNRALQDAMNTEAPTLGLDFSPENLGVVEAARPLPLTGSALPSEPLPGEHVPGDITGNIARLAPAGSEPATPFSDETERVMEEARAALALHEERVRREQARLEPIPETGAFQWGPNGPQSPPVGLSPPPAEAERPVPDLRSLPNDPAAQFSASGAYFPATGNVDDPIGAQIAAIMAAAPAPVPGLARYNTGPNVSRPAAGELTPPPHLSAVGGYGAGGVRGYADPATSARTGPYERSAIEEARSWAARPSARAEQSEPYWDPDTGELMVPQRWIDGTTRMGPVSEWELIQARPYDGPVPPRPVPERQPIPETGAFQWGPNGYQAPPVGLSQMQATPETERATNSSIPSPVEMRRADANMDVARMERDARETPNGSIDMWDRLRRGSGELSDFYHSATAGRGQYWRGVGDQLAYLINGQEALDARTAGREPIEPETGPTWLERMAGGVADVGERLQDAPLVDPVVGQAALAALGATPGEQVPEPAAGPEQAASAFVPAEAMASTAFTLSPERAAAIGGVRTGTEAPPPPASPPAREVAEGGVAAAGGGTPSPQASTAPTPTPPPPPTTTGAPAGGAYRPARPYGVAPGAETTTGGPPPVTPSVAGNITDLDTRPRVPMADGSAASVLSMSIGTDQGEVLIPRVVNGQVLSEEDAIRHYNETGEHLGIFNSPAEANAYSQWLSDQQGRTGPGPSAERQVFDPMALYRELLADMPEAPDTSLNWGDAGRIAMRGGLAMAAAGGQPGATWGGGIGTGGMAAMNEADSIVQGRQEQAAAAQERATELAGKVVDFAVEGERLRQSNATDEERSRHNQVMEQLAQARLEIAQQVAARGASGGGGGAGNNAYGYTVEQQLGFNREARLYREMLERSGSGDFLGEQTIDPAEIERQVALANPNADTSRIWALQELETILSTAEQAAVDDGGTLSTGSIADIEREIEMLVMRFPYMANVVGNALGG